MTTGFFTDERCFWHSTGEHALVVPVGGFVQPPASAGHAESAESKRRLLGLVTVSGLLADLNVASAPPVSLAQLQQVHTPEYLAQFKALSDAGGGALAPGAPFGRGSFEIAALSAGLVLQAATEVLSGRLTNAYALSRPPGHHCLADRPMGFCLLANIPIAIEALRQSHGLGRVAVLDWDVHHGNGTQEIYYDRDDTLTISIHQNNCFPPGAGAESERGRGNGLGFNLNIPLLPGAGHQSYLDAMQMLVLPALEAFAPELIIIACGLDANGCDPLARMLAHSDTFREMTRMMKAAAKRLCGGKLVVVHEGGYAEAVVPFCGLAVIEELASRKTAVEDPFLALLQLQQPPQDMVDFQHSRLAGQAQRLAAANTSGIS